jgi:zinc/manganese transport system ATP-binding protein
VTPSSGRGEARLALDDDEASPALASETPPAVVADRVEAAYGGRVVWSGASFAIPSGAFCAVLGPNGSGKSTLMRMLLGLLRPRAGRLEVMGEEPRRGNPSIGYVPQASSFDPDFGIRGRDYVGLGLDGHRWGVRSPFGLPDKRSLVEAAIRAVEATEFADQPMGRLSGGEQQRLILAQSLVGNPQILLLDEPLSNLDVRNRASIVQLLDDVRRRRALTVVLVAHDVNPLLRFLDLVIYVAKGRLAVGPPSEVITSESLSSIYGAPVEVVRDRRGRIFVVGLEEEAGHPHPA